LLHGKDRRIVDQQVDRAVFFDGGIDHAKDVVAAGNIAGDGSGFTTGLANRCHRSSPYFSVRVATMTLAPSAASTSAMPRRCRAHPLQSPLCRLISPLASSHPDDAFPFKIS